MNSSDVKWIIKIKDSVCYTNKRLDKDMIKQLIDMGIEIKRLSTEEINKI